MAFNEPLIILGMHRSGTSITTKWLSQCGFHVGDDLMVAHFTNKSGHFEDMDFYQFHESVFERCKIGSGGFEQLDRLTIGDRERLEAENLIAGKKAHDRQWAWKDPRTCLFMELYRELLPEARLLVISRNYHDIVNSLIKREWNYIRKDITSQAKWGPLSFWSFALRKGKKTKKDFGKMFSKATVSYLEHILAAIEQWPEGQRCVIDLESLASGRDGEILERLQEMGYSIEKKAFSTVFDPGQPAQDGNCAYIPGDVLGRLDELKNAIGAYAL